MLVCGFAKAVDCNLAMASGEPVEGARYVAPASYQVDASPDRPLICGFPAVVKWIFEIRARQQRAWRENKTVKLECFHL